jgi:cell division protein FtsW (lipid II flippase)
MTLATWLLIRRSVAPAGSAVRKRKRMRRVRAVALVVHVLAAVGWIAGLAIVLVVDERVSNAVMWWVLVPAVVAVLITGPVLTRPWLRGATWSKIWLRGVPLWLNVKIALLVAVLVQAASVVERIPSPVRVFDARLFALGLLALMLVFSVLKPDRRKASATNPAAWSITPPSDAKASGRHRK